MKAEIYASWVFVAYFAVWVAGFITSWRFRSRLQKNYPHLASKYAVPMFEASIPESWAAGKFVLSQQYRSIGDEKLDRLGDWSYNLFWAMVILFGIFVALLILSTKGY